MGLLLKNVKFFSILKCKIFCFKLSDSSRKPIKKFLHFKMLTLQNVSFEMSEYSNMTYVVKR